MNYPIITENDPGIRPAGKSDECFYCRRKVGEEHGPECVIVTKLIQLEATITYEVRVPHYWTSEDIYFRYNEGGWCAHNFTRDLNAYAKRKQEGDENKCVLCPVFSTAYIETVDETPTVDES